MNSFINFLENGRVVKYKDVFQLNEERVNSVVTKATMIMERLKNIRLKTILQDFLRLEKRPPMPGTENSEMKSTITSSWTIDCTLRQGLFGSSLQEIELFAPFPIRIGF